MTYIVRRILQGATQIRYLTDIGTDTGIDTDTLYHKYVIQMQGAIFSNTLKIDIYIYIYTDLFLKEILICKLL